MARSAAIAVRRHHRYLTERLQRSRQHPDPLRVDAVIVHDLIYARTVGGQWSLKKSCYRKLRLAAPWVCDELSAAGFRITTCRQGRMTEIAAQRSREP